MCVGWGLNCNWQGKEKERERETQAESVFFLLTFISLLWKNISFWDESGLENGARRLEARQKKP